MKTFFMFLIFLTISQARADWTNISPTEPLTGCAMFAGANYFSTSGNQTQALIIGCLMGGAASYYINQHAMSEASSKYQNKIDTLQNQLDEVVLQQSINTAEGIGEYGVVIKKTPVPAKKLQDGTIQLPTMRLEVELPGEGLIIGD